MFRKQIGFVLLGLCLACMVAGWAAPQKPQPKGKRGIVGEMRGKGGRAKMRTLAQKPHAALSTAELQQKMALSVVPMRWDLSAMFDPHYVAVWPWTWGACPAGSNTTSFRSYTHYYTSLHGLPLLAATYANSPEPHLLKNASAGQTNFNAITWNPGELSLHPGPGREMSMARFVVPATGNYHVSVNLYGVDRACTTNGFISYNGGIFDRGQVTGYRGASAAFRREADWFLRGGDTLDFGVDDGGNGYVSDSTGVSVVITAL